MTKVTDPAHDARTIEGRPTILTKPLFVVGVYDLSKPADIVRLTTVLAGLEVNYAAVGETKVKVYLEHIHEGTVTEQ